ncbi:MAG: alpha/beta hydrolase [Chloroflexi bacterium]|nr:alpha/beta hydrolase [Chloroflexota bacterium]
MVTDKPQDCYASVNGLKLHYLDWGTEGKPAMLLLHGFTGNAHAWDRFAPSVQPFYHVLALDQRGHGDSGWASDGYTTDRYVADLTSVIAALGLSPVTLVGLSMGGINAMVYAALHPESVTRLVVVDVGPEPSPASLARWDQPPPPEPESFGSLEEVMQFLHQGDPRPPMEWWQHLVPYCVMRRSDGRLIWRHDPALLNRTKPDAARAAFLWEKWRQIRCPTLVLRGGESDVLAIETAQKMLAEQPNARLVEIAGSGHTIQEDQAEAFEAAVRDFLGC